MTLELTITLLLALLFSAGRAHGQAGTFLDPGVGPQPTTGFRVSVATPPITASFTYSPSSGAWPLTVQFVGGTDYQCGVGTSSPSVTTNDLGFTNAGISLRVLGDTDCIFIDTTNHCQLISFGSRLQSTWDTAAVNGKYAAHDIRFYGGSMTNKGVNANGAGSGGVFIGSTNTQVFCQAMPFYSDKQGYAGHLLQSPVEVFSSCSFDIPNATTDWVIFEPTPGIKKATLVLLNCNILDSAIANSFGGFVVRTNLP